MERIKEFEFEVAKMHEVPKVKELADFIKENLDPRKAEFSYFSAIWKKIKIGIKVNADEEE